MWSCSKQLAYMVANIFAKESEKRRQSTNKELWSRSDPITTYVKNKKHSWSDYGTKIKDQPQQLTWPRSPQLGTTTDHKGKTHSNNESLHRTPTWAQAHHLERYHRSLHLVLEVNCESRGLSNLAPSQSRLFKLMGRVKGMRWSCSKRLAYMVDKIRKREREEKAKHDRETMIKKWS